MAVRRIYEIFDSLTPVDTLKLEDAELNVVLRTFNYVILFLYRAMLLYLLSNGHQF